MKAAACNYSQGLKTASMNGKDQHEELLHTNTNLLLIPL